MQEKTIKRLDKNNRITLIGVYDNAIEEIERELAKRPYLNKRTITFREFRSVVKPYLGFIVDYIMKGFEFTLPNKFGALRIIKKRTNKKQRYYKPENVDEFYTEGYWHKLYWFRPDKWKNINVKLSPTQTKKMMKQVNRGYEYADFTE
jgi:hypothetical protein